MIFLRQLTNQQRNNLYKIYGAIKEENNNNNLRNNKIEPDFLN